MANEIIFLLTHKINDVILRNIHKINQEKGERDFHVLMHGQKNTADLQVPFTSFSLEQLKALNFEMLEEDSMFSSVHLALFYFFKKFPDYDRYWFIEYDVEFGGNWQYLFDTYINSNADFISSYIQRYNKKLNWYWWGIDHPEKEIAISERVRSFNPIFRISNRALQFLSEELKTGWKGHCEVLISTILHFNNFELLDFGDGGDFNIPQYSNFYKESANFPSEDFRFLKLGSHRYRPSMKKAGPRKLIYHPVKMDSGLSRVEEMKLQISLLKKKMKNYLGQVL